MTIKHCIQLAIIAALITYTVGNARFLSTLK